MSDTLLFILNNTSQLIKLICKGSLITVLSTLILLLSLVHGPELSIFLSHLLQVLNKTLIIPESCSFFR